MSPSAKPLWVNTVPPSKVAVRLTLADALRMRVLTPGRIRIGAFAFDVVVEM